MKCYIDVPFKEKDEAKSLGAKWDPDERSWYCPQNQRNRFVQWKNRKRDLISLKGEDRHFGGNELFVDLIPQSCWFTNVRSCIHPSDWDRLRRFVYKRANNECECCGSSKEIEAHERWSYSKDLSIQKLERIIALCKKCHMVTHFGLTRLRGKKEEAYDHLIKVRSLTRVEAEEHVNFAFQQWDRRNLYQWQLDLSILEDSNIKIRKITTPTNNIETEAGIEKPDTYEYIESDDYDVISKENGQKNRGFNLIRFISGIFKRSTKRVVKKQLKLSRKNRSRITQEEAINRTITILFEESFIYNIWCIKGFNHPGQIELLGNKPLAVIFDEKTGDDGDYTCSFVVNRKYVASLLEQFMSKKHVDFKKSVSILAKFIYEEIHRRISQLAKEEGPEGIRYYYNHFELHEVAPLELQPNE